MVTFLISLAGAMEAFVKGNVVPGWCICIGFRSKLLNGCDNYKHNQTQTHKIYFCIDFLSTNYTELHLKTGLVGHPCQFAVKINNH